MSELQCQVPPNVWYQKNIFMYARHRQNNALKIRQNLMGHTAHGGHTAQGGHTAHGGVFDLAVEQPQLFRKLHKNKSLFMVCTNTNFTCMETPHDPNV